MTLLMFHQWATGARIYMDTLVVDADHVPKGYQYKVWTFPHLNMVMATTGTAEVATLLGDQLAGPHGLSDIDAVNDVAPAELRRIYAWLTEAQGDIGTATVYMFGFPDGSDKLVRYIYRSVMNFEPERHREETEDPQFAVKPPPRSFELTYPWTKEEIVDMANRVRDERMKGLTDDDIPIGGELFATTVNEGTIYTERLHRFV